MPYCCLDRVAAAEVRIGIADDGVASDVGVLLDHDDVRAKFARAKGGRKARGACADDNDVCVDIPSPNFAKNLRRLAS